MAQITLVTGSGGMSNAFENTILNHVFRSASGTSGSCYIALYKDTSYSASAFEIDTANEVVATYNYYQRSASGIWDIFTNSASISGCAMNGSPIKFAAIGGTWSDMGPKGEKVFGFGLRSGSWSGLSGSLMFYGPIGGFSNYQNSTYDSGRNILQNETLTFSASAIKVKIGPPISPALSGSLLKHYLNGVRLSASSINLWLGLYTIPSNGSFTPGTYISIANPFISGSTELSVGGYSRLKVGPSASSWSTPGTQSASGLTYNTENIIFFQ